MDTLITDLPPHLIEKILSYCFRNRHELKTVCKGFYEAIWKINEGSYCLNIEPVGQDQYSKLESKLTNILKNSVSHCHQVRFANVRMDGNWIFQKEPPFKLKKIFRKFFKSKGDFVRKLEVYNLLNESQADKILRHTKSLTKLVLQFRVTKIEILDLSGLESLREIEILNDGYILRNVKMPKGRIETVKISAPKLIESDLFEFLKCENSFKKLKLNVEKFEESDGNFSHQLEELSIERGDIPPGIYEKLLTFQVDLTVLELKSEISDETFDLLTSNLHKLKELSLCLNRISPENVDKLDRLRSLKLLNIHHTNLDELFKSDFQLKVPSLFLYYCELSTDEAVRHLTRKFSKLTNFGFCCSYNDRFRNQDEVFLQLQHLKEVKFTYFESVRFHRPNIHNENLERMAINGLIILEIDFLRSFPNLTELDIFVDQNYVDSLKTEVEAVFREFSKLKKILLAFYENYSLDFDILALVNENSNLELIHLSNITFKSPSIRSDNLRNFEIFQCKTVDGNSSLLIATDADVLLKAKENFQKSIFVRSWSVPHRIDVIKDFYDALKYVNVFDEIY